MPRPGFLNAAEADPYPLVPAPGGVLLSTPSPAAPVVGTPPRPPDYVAPAGGPGYLGPGLSRYLALQVGGAGLAAPDPGAAPAPPDRTAVALPRDALLDFGCVLGLDADYVDPLDSVYLHAVSRDGDTFAFEFRSTAAGLAGVALRFGRALGDPEFAASEAAAPGAAGGPDLWEGFLVTGPLDALAAAIPPGGRLEAGTPGLAVVEPALVQNLARGFVRSVGLANEDRTRAAPPDGCPGAILPPAYAAVVNTAGLAGPLVIRPGFNCTVLQNNRANSLTIGAAVGAGLGQPCDEVPLHAGEAPPPGSSLLSGGPACDELVSTINGVGSGSIQLVAVQGLTIAPSATAANTLVVSVDLHDLATCPAAGA